MPLLLFRGIKHTARTICISSLLVWAAVTAVNLIDKWGPNIPPYEKEYDVGLVVASLKKTDVTWLNKFPNWSPQIYVVDNDIGKDVPINKGHEAMVYLTYIIENYDNLREVEVFIHGDRYQWHNDDEKHDSKRILKTLRTKPIIEDGYVNLRCHLEQGCSEGLELTQKYNPDDWRYVFNNAWLEQYARWFPGKDTPKTVKVPCCAQFAVSRQKIHEHPIEFYTKVRQWLIDTPLEDSFSGRVMEYFWHVIFGKSSDYCPDPATCYCRLYGRCNLKCVDGKCGVYVYPFGPERSYYDRFKDIFYNAWRKYKWRREKANSQKPQQ